jgi:hypothetical protein
MNNALKSFISFSLSFFILSITFHIDHVDHDQYEGYSICDISCNDEGHHASSHHCEKCLNKTHRIMVQASIDAYSNRHHLSIYSLNENSNNKLLTYKLYSRPPPKLL